MSKNTPTWDVLEHLFQKPEQWDEPASTYQEVMVEIEKVSKPGTQVWHWQDLDKDKAICFVSATDGGQVGGRRWKW